MPGAGAPFQHFCVMQPGTNNCPAGFPTQHVYHAGVSDSRGCTPCTCGSPSGVDCNAAAQLHTWGNPSCSANVGPTLSPLPLGCNSAASTHSVELTTSATGGSCDPDGGQPMGSVSAQGVTTICCTL
jgi:hypothetical protein